MTSHTRIATPQQLISSRFTNCVWFDGAGFLPWRGTKDGRFGEGGGEGERRPRRVATVGERKVDEVADRIEGLTWE